MWHRLIERQDNICVCGADAQIVIGDHQVQVSVEFFTKSNLKQLYQDYYLNLISLDEQRSQAKSQNES